MALEPLSVKINHEVRKSGAKLGTQGHELKLYGNDVVLTIPQLKGYLLLLMEGTQQYCLIWINEEETPFAFRRDWSITAFSSF